MELTQKLLNRLFDYKDGFLYWKEKTHHKSTINIGDKAGCLKNSKDGARYFIVIYGKAYASSRLIFFYHNGYFPEIVDHRDRDKLNDKIENLRAASSSQNNKNRSSAKGSYSKYLGVCFHKRDKYWYALITINGEQEYLGRFKTETEAALAYNESAIINHGEFANLNKIDL